MAYKPILFLILVVAISSCGSPKQLASASSEKSSKTEEFDTTNSDTIEIVNEVEVESKDIVAQTEIETSTQKHDSLISNHTLKKNDSVYFIYLAKHDKWHKLLQKHVSKGGNVNYKGFANEKTELRSYINHLKENSPKNNWNKNHKLAYWINAYNAFTIDLIIRNYPIKSIKDLKDPWDQRFWKIGEKWYNLNDIEHQILRKMDEPRIHFAIVCASISCPKLQNTAFYGWKLDEQLTNATKEFLSDSSKNVITENSVELSKIFKWFSKDFKAKNNNVIDFLNQYASVQISENAKKSYLDYNWDLND